ncbi:hypothetical protein ACIQHU_39085 [Streptomyces tendae]|uniref:hypothetical protein n=1 Tax=Streptomyces tendae TaxID=1932 RepID=UPI00382ED0A2
MSVNYYAFGPFPGGEPDGEGLHIGQYAGQHRFLMRAHPDQNLTTLADWLDFLRQPQTVIRAEHGVQLSVEEMEATIRERETGQGWPRRDRWVHGRERDGCHVDPEGVEFCALEFC